MKHDHGHDGEQAEKVAIPVHKESLNLRKYAVAGIRTTFRPGGVALPSFGAA